MADAEVDHDAHLDFRTYIPQTVWDEYHLALGRFMHCFAKVELNLSLQLSSLLDAAVYPKESTPEPDAQKGAKFWLRRQAAIRAVLGSMRIKGLQDGFKRLFYVMDADADIVKEYQRVMAHLSEIHYIRDRLAHNGAVPNMTDKENWFYTSDLYSKNLQKDYSIIYFKAIHLEYMARDLEVMPQLLSAVFDRDMYERVQQEPSMQTPAMLAHQADVHGPFRYKPSELRREGPKFGPSLSR